MTIELPVLRLGLAGFSAEQQESVRAILNDQTPGTVVWELAPLDVADAWFVNGARTKLVDSERISVAAAVPTARALHVRLAEVDRPVAFARPLPSGMEAPYSFDASSRPAVG